MTTKSREIMNQVSHKHVAGMLDRMLPAAGSTIGEHDRQPAAAIIATLIGCEAQTVRVLMAATKPAIRHSLTTWGFVRFCYYFHIKGDMFKYKYRPATLYGSIRPGGTYMRPTIKTITRGRRGS